MQLQLTIDLRGVLIGAVVLLVGGAIAAPFAVSLADGENNEADAVRDQRGALGTAFTYQGRLETGGSPANGLHDFEFQLFDDATPGAPDVQVGPPVAKTNVPVTDGLFAVELNFGGSAFDGNARWLEVKAMASAGGAFETLAPRQPLTPVPYALFALHGGTQYSAGTGISLTGTQFSVEFLSAGPVNGIASTAARGDHIHFGQTWTGVSLAPALDVSNADGHGLRGVSANGQSSGVYGDNTSGGYGLYGRTTGAGIGVYGTAPGGYGVLGVSTSNDGVVGTSQTARGVYAQSNGLGPNGAALFAHNLGGGIGAWTEANTSDAVTVIRNAGTGDLIKAFNASYAVKFRVASNGYTELTAVNVNRQLGVGAAAVHINNDGLGNSIYAQSSHPDAKVFQVTPTGAVYAKSYHTSAFDLAEDVPFSGRPPSPGDVVEIDPGVPGRFRIAETANSALVVGIVATDPGFVLGSDSDGASSDPPLALAGRVPVRASAESGPIVPGDLLVSSSTPGHAMRAPLNPAPGTVIGKALGSLDSGTGLMTVFVMLR